MADAPIIVRTAGGREAIALENMGRGWYLVELDANANNEGGAGERKKMRNFAPGQEHLLNAVPQAAPKPMPPPPVRPKRGNDEATLAKKEQDKAAKEARIAEEEKKRDKKRKMDKERQL